jgi:hypothetical protein
MNDLKFIKNNKSNKLNKLNKLNKNIYFFIYCIYKYILLKDFIIKYYKILLNFFPINLYDKIKECRFYFLFYFFLLKKYMYEFINNLYFLIDKKYISSKKGKKLE